MTIGALPLHLRYLTGLVLAFLLSGILIAGTLVPTTILAGRRPRLHTVIDLWAFFGLIIVATLAVIVGPVILLLRRWWGANLAVGWTITAGAASGPLMMIVAWLIVRERWETLGGLLLFWLRLPMEFVIGALPNAAAGALFAWWLVREPAPARASRRGRGSSPAQ
jgi:hypothetical protein